MDKCHIAPEGAGSCQAHGGNQRSSPRYTLYMLGAAVLLVPVLVHCVVTTRPGPGTPRMRLTVSVTELLLAKASNSSQPSASQLLLQQAPELARSRGFKRCRGPGPREVVPHLQSVRVWRSAKARQQDSVTIATMLSLSRLGMLENQCSIWPGPVAAVIYLPTVQGQVSSADTPPMNGVPMEMALAALDSFHQRAELQGNCTLDLEALTEEFQDGEQAGIYPINAARNRAVMLAQTEAMLLLDVDFVPMPALATEYRTPEAYARLVNLLRRPQVLVIPAFEVASPGEDGRKMVFKAVQSGKNFVVEQMRRGKMNQFQLYKYRKEHLATDYGKWMQAGTAYQVEYQPPAYAPYIIASKHYIPWYDERFRGYGKDKIAWMRHFSEGLNVTFIVHPTAFVVHVPHSKGINNKASARSGQAEKLKALLYEVGEQLKKHRFVPVVSAPELCDE